MAVAAAVLGAAVPRAAAQEAAATPAEEPGEPPACAQLDRADGVNRAGVAAGWSSLNDSDLVDFTALRFDVFGQWLAPVGTGRAGGYAILPVSYARIDPDVGPTNAEWVLGDAELGGVYRLRLAPELEAAAHIGATLPTAPEGTFSSTEITGFANSFAIYARPNDLVQAAPQTSYLRLGVSPIYLSGGLFARADLAVDVPLHSGAGGDLLTLGRVNGAVGARIGQNVAMLEVVNLIALENPDGDESDRLLSFIGLTGVFGAMQGRWQIIPSLLVPLDDEINDAVDLAFILGVQAFLP